MDDHSLASRWQRLGGYLLDLLIVGVILYLLMSLTGTVEQLRTEAGLSIGQQLIWVAISLALFVALNGYLLAKDGETIGKQLVKTRIVDLEGEVPPFGKLILLRYAVFTFLVLIPILGPIIGLLDSLWIFGREKRCLHDVLAGTKVVSPAPGTSEYVRGLTPVARRILQGTALIAVILIGLIIYRGSLIATGERLEPDDYQLAFLKQHPRGFRDNDVYVLDVERGEVTQMTMNYKTRDMRWTTDGQEMIINWANRSYLLNVITGEAKQLGDDPAIPDLDGWSPDGQQRVFSAQNENDVDSEIYVTSAGDTEQRWLVKNPGADHDPTWSLDGQQIAFWTELDESWSLSVVNADGTNLNQIAEQPVPFAPITGLHWAPNGSNLLFVSPVEFDPQWGSVRAAHIFVIDTEGQNLIDVGDINWTQTGRHPPARGWSPNGRMIVFDGLITVGGFQHAALCFFSLDDDEPDCQYQSDVQRITPSWSPDGRYLAYTRYSYGRSPSSYDICVMEMTTGYERCFEEITEGGYSPVWRP